MPEPATSLRHEAATLAPPALFLAGVLEVATRHDAGHRALALAALTILVTHVVPGTLVWRAVRPLRGWLIEDLVMGLAIGVALAVPSHIVAVALGQPWLDVALPLAVAVALLAVPATRLRIRSRSLDRLPWGWGAAVAMSSVGPLLSVLDAFATPLRWRGWAKFYVDVPFQQAVTGELLHHMPPHYPQAALEPLEYHWFTHAWTAHVASVSGAEIDVLLWRFNPALLMIVTPLIVAVAAMRLSGRAWAGPVAALLAFLLPDVVPWAPATISTPLHSSMSPTQNLAAFLIVAVVTLVAVRWRQEAARGSLPLLVLLLVITGGTKGSTLPVVFAGMLLASAVVVVLRIRPARTVATDTFLTGAVLIGLMTLLFGDAGERPMLDFGQAFAQVMGESIAAAPIDVQGGTWIAVGLLAVLSILLGPIAALGLLSDATTRRDPLAWLLLGGGAAGLGAMVLLSMTGFAQFYFYKSAESLIVLSAAWGATEVVRRAGSLRAVLSAGIVIGVLALEAAHFVAALDESAHLGRALLTLAVFLALVGLGALLFARSTHGRARAAVGVTAVAFMAAPSVAAAQAIADWEPPPAAVHSAAVPKSLHFEDAQALRWLREHSSPDAIVATNLHCLDRVADPCDRRRFFIGAVAERRTLIEGWTYTGRATKLYAEFGSAMFTDRQFWDQDLLALNDGFIERPTALGARRLHDLGVRWIVVWHEAPHARDLSPYATRMHRGKTMTLHRLESPRQSPP